MGFIVLFSFMGFLVFGQGLTKADSIYSKGRDFTRTGYSDSAIVYYQRAAKIFLEEGREEKALLSQAKEGDEYAIMRQFDPAYRLLDKTIIRAREIQANQVLLDAFKIKGIAKESEYKINEALANYDSALMYASPLKTREDYLAYTSVYRYIGIAHLRSRNVLKAKPYFDRYAALYDSLKVEGVALARMNNDLGNLYSNLTEIDKSIEYYLKAKEIYRVTQPESYMAGLVSMNIASAYQTLRQYTKALSNYEDAITLFKKTQWADRYLPDAIMGAGKNHNTLGNTDQAQEYFEKARKLILDNYGANSSFLFDLQMTIADAFYTNQQYDLAMRNYEKADFIYNKMTSGKQLSKYYENRFWWGFSMYKNGDKEAGMEKMKKAVNNLSETSNYQGFAVYSSNARVAESYLEFDKPDSALKYAHIALKAFAPDFNNPDVEAIPENGPNIEYATLLYTSFLKIKAWKLKYDLYKDDADLSRALKMYQKLDTYMQKTRELAGARGRQSQQYFSSLFSGWTTGILEVTHALYDLTGKREHALLAFQLLDKNKAKGVLSDNNSKYGDSFTLPESYAKEEIELNSQLTFLEVSIDRQKSNNSPDSLVLKDLEKQLQEMEQNKLLFVQKVKRNFPNHYRLRYTENTISLSSLQEQLNNKETFITFHIDEAEGLLFSFQVYNKGFNFTKTPLDSLFDDHLLQLSKELTKPGMSVDKYLQSSNYLMNHLFPDTTTLTDFDKITIIPHGVLHNLPFHVLVKPSQKEQKDFKNLNYLLKDHAIHYGLSAGFIYNTNTYTANRENTVLGFAPSYNTDKSQSDSIRRGLGNLAFTQLELDNISNYFEVTDFADMKASEQQFREKAPDYSIIHLASHGLLNKKNSLFSNLVFAPSELDSLNDGFLTTREIINLNLPVKMVVLSACETGLGDLIPGEGTMSLANGFFYAGAKSVVTTLWTANDESTAHVMGDFYKYLAEGSTKSLALQKAQLDYLSQTNNLLAHPYFWAHFTVNGNDAPIVNNNRSLWYWGVAMLIFMLIATVVIRYKRSLR